MAAERFLVSFKLTPATNHKGNDVSKCGGDWTARGGRSEVLNLHSFQCETRDSSRVQPSIRAITSRSVEPMGLALRKEYSVGVWERRQKRGPLTSAERQ
ncbi:hypothetical protein CesoFtcFv8_015412 [Champsocephalus esox]|uniref:Uncharacterized protein n=1 Tax=Champsocephalus esox TaxID=159716 RepID=A0AAN8GVA0_9TELE|nr:hypothetical protein CesoFtcFv8_015412 [Champsocephalus esox]